MSRRNSESNPERQPETPAIAASDVPREVEQRLAQAEPQVELLSVEVSSSHGQRIVRLFIDTEGGVTHETCARVSGHLVDLLREYSVEVSSPGPQRPLTKPDHFRRFVGRRARVRTFEAIEGRNDFKGELIDAGDRSITLAGAWGTLSIDYDQIRRANLLPQEPHEPQAGRASE